MSLKYSIDVDTNFNFLSEDYKSLFLQADSTAFQSPLWMHHLHTILLPKLEAQQYTIVIRSQDKQALLAVFPFIIQKALLGIDIIQFADFGVCDYNSVVGQNSMLTALAHDKAVLKKLDKLVGAGHLLLMRKLRADLFDVRRFFQKMTRTPHAKATYNCRVGADAEAWEQEKLSKSWRKNQRRKARKFTKEIGQWVFSEVKTVKQMDAAMEVIADIHKDRYEDSLVQHDIYKDFYTSYLKDAWRQGEATMYVLTLESQILAAEFGFLYKDSYQGILVAAQTGQYSKFSIGYQMIFNVIRDIVSKGYRNFDLGLGNQAYKQRFHAQETILYDYTLALSVTGAVGAPIYHYVKPIVSILKKYAPHLH